MHDIFDLLNKPEFPRSSRYDHAWMMDNQMGPNALWLSEWLTEVLPLESGMRVLDLGCGRAMTSIFLAKEFGVRVWAADLWISPDHNWQRVMEAGLQDQVFPLRAEAHALAFPQGFFDAVVSFDAYQYFGTDTLYLNYISGFVRQGGLLGIVVPGLMQPVEDSLPEHLARPQSNGKVFWEEDCWSFKTARWWKALWGKSNRVENIQVDEMQQGWRHWRDFEAALAASGKNVFPSDVETLEQDQGRYIGFVRALAARNATAPMNLYDPAVGVQAGVDT